MVSWRLPMHHITAQQTHTQAPLPEHAGTGAKLWLLRGLPSLSLSNLVMIDISADMFHQCKFPLTASFFSFQKVGSWSCVSSEEAPWPTRLPLTFSLINKTTNWSFLILDTLVIKSLLRWNETLNFMSRHHEHVSWRGRDWQDFSHQIYNPLSLTLCAAILCVIFETCRISFLVLYSHISPNIPEQLEPLVCFNNTFLLPRVLSPFGGVQEEEGKRPNFFQRGTEIVLGEGQQSPLRV